MSDTISLPSHLYGKAKKRNKICMLLMVVQLPSKIIWNIMGIDYMKIKIKAKCMRIGIMQCHRGQNFDRIQSKCRQISSCVKCDENYFTESYPNNTDATHANCGDFHPAIYKGCRHFSQNKNKQQNTISMQKRLHKLGSCHQATKHDTSIKEGIQQMTSPLK